MIHALLDLGSVLLLAALFECHSILNPVRRHILAKWLRLALLP
jgi:hypothetical protein